MRTTPSQTLYVIPGLVSAALLYGLFGIISRVIGYNIPLFYQSWIRVFVASAVLVWTYRSWKRLPFRDWVIVSVRAIAGLVAFLLFFISVNAMPVSLSYFIFYGGSTVGGYLYGALLFREKTTKLRLFCLLLAGIGLALVYGVSSTTTTLGLVSLTFVSGICTATWNTLSKLVTSYPPTQLAFLDNALSVPVDIGVSLLIGETWPAFTLSTAQTANILLGVLFAVTGILMVYGFRRLDAQIGSLIMLSEILFAIFFGFLFYHEAPSVGAAFGGILIVTAMALPEINWSTVSIFSSYARRRKNHRR